MIPEKLYYNCDSPINILLSANIFRSKIFRGVSMSAWEQLGSHGPFKIAFRQAPWFAQFKPVTYGAAKDGHKNVMFKDEQEWHSPDEVNFKIADVEYVMHMTNAPAGIGPIIRKRTIDVLKRTWPQLYREGVVNDPYLSRK